MIELKIMLPTNLSYLNKFEDGFIMIEFDLIGDKLDDIHEAIALKLNEEGSVDYIKL